MPALHRPIRTHSIARVAVNRHPIEADFIREKFVTINGQRIAIYVAHRDSRCDVCEFPLHNARKHPVDPDRPDVHIVCGGHRVRLVRS